MADTTTTSNGKADPPAFGTMGRAVAAADKAKSQDKSRVVQMGRRIVRAREAKGWTTEDLSRKARVRYHSLYSYERGQKVPSAFNVCRIAQALGVSVEALCGFQRANPAPKKPTPADA